MRYTVILKNLISGEVFEKHFDSPYLMNIFKTKCRYSKKIRCIGNIDNHGY